MKKLYTNFAVALLGLLIACSSPAMAEEFKAGKHYQQLPKEITRQDVIENITKEANGKVQVLEFFSYGCSWCYKLDPYIEKWSAKQDTSKINFQRVPVEFQPSWRTLTRAYYVAQDLNVLDKIHEPLFKAIHSDEITSSAEDVLKEFFVKKGVNPEDFDKAFDSFTTHRQQKWANSVSRAFKVTAIPMVIVQGENGSFLTSVRMAGSEEKFLQVIDYLAHNKASSQK